LTLNEAGDRNLSKENVIGFILVGIAPVSRLIPVYALLKTMKEISEMHEVTGEFEIILRVLARNAAELKQLADQIRSIEGVYKLETLISTNRLV
jgi:DNA-binding Lrp family transcriptional regulator